MKNSSLIFALAIISGCHDHVDYYHEKVSKRNAVLRCRASATPNERNAKTAAGRCSQLEDEYRHTYGVLPDE